jgi:hypothetical protein
MLSSFLSHDVFFGTIQPQLLKCLLNFQKKITHIPIPPTQFSQIVRIMSAPERSNKDRVLIFDVDGTLTVCFSLFPDLALLLRPVSLTQI